MGVVLLVFGGFNEAFTKRVAILPPRLFKVSFQFEVGMCLDITTKTRTAGCLLVAAFFHSTVFIPMV